MRYLVLIMTVLFPGLSHGQQPNYPPTIERTTVTNYYGKEITDEYRWLEDVDRPEVKIWVANQSELTKKFLKKIANKHNSKNLMNKYMVREIRWNTHHNINFDNNRNENYRFFYQNQFSTPSIYYKENTFNDFKVLVDPRDISNKDRIVLQSFSPSKNNKYLAYSFNRNGSDWREIQIISTSNQGSPTESLKDVRFSGINWCGNGFYYTRYPPSSITEKLGKPAIYYHQLFTEQAEDSLIFQSPNPDDELNLYSNYDETIYVLEVENRIDHQHSYFYYDPREEIRAFRPLFYKVRFSLTFVHFKNDRLIMRAASGGKTQLVSIDKKAPGNLKTISPSIEGAYLTNYEILPDQIILSYQAIDQPYLIAIDYEGNILNKAKLPSGVTVSSISYQKADQEVLFYLESYTIPPVICRLNRQNFSYNVVERTGVNYDFQDFKYEVRMVQSDSVEIPVFLVYKGALKPNSKTPVLLKSYGGFGVISTPRYDPNTIYFIEQGGIFAYAYVRGGGEKGNHWWHEGKYLNKINGVNDLISVSEYLIDENLTAKKKIAVTGASHGGLLAASALIKRPDLFGAGVFHAGLMDMLRYENYTVGPKWISEFGTVTDSVGFYNLMTYSPYHRLELQTDYPPSLFITGQSDDRVSPFHSYKMAARMQNLAAQENPILLWAKQGTGHFGPDNMEDQLIENAYIMGFLDEYILSQND
ncbi:prolyl oligopeptidase family serine peptidase [Marinoscillum sp.]|uniref:prolyl oligopeptidase family serine peptidase n=1 Tax=Marinoscillum sp. TaxID=2024838 RepID=UPI003BAC5716